jgi:hypothetical protein
MARRSEHRNSALAPTNIVCPEHGRPSTLPKLSKEDEASFKSGKVKGKLAGSLSHMVPLKSRRDNPIHWVSRRAYIGCIQDKF